VPTTTYGSYNKIPTLLGSAGALGRGNYTANHPVGLNAVVSCGGSNWDCSEANGVISMTGPRSSRFVQNYGFFPMLAAYNNKAVVLCTSCHDPHLMNIASVSGGSTSGLPSGTYRSMFFIRAPSDPASSGAGSNQAAQFCRMCHGDKSNEMNGSTAVTVF
jgi:hypothetical protein